MARDGTNRWEVKEGSAKIRINYNTETFFITGDAYLCQLPPGGQQIKTLYQYLLEQNNDAIDGLVLSCVNQNVVLSGVIYDLDITKESGTKLFQNLFKKADEYDNILINQFGCLPRLQES